ncbi:MAG: CvpA family protein [Bauldia sp.]
MPIPIVDGIVVLVILISAVLAMVRGFVREVLSVAAWVAAAGCAYAFYQQAVPLITPYITSVNVAKILAAAGIFFVALLVASFITMKIADFVIDSRIGTLDRLLGFAFGAARGVLLMVIAMTFFDFLVRPAPEWIASSYSRDKLLAIGERLMAALPADLVSEFDKRMNGLTGKDRALLPDDARTQPGYGNSDRQRLNQVIQNGAGN